MNIDWNEAPEWAIAHALYAFGGEISEVWVGEGEFQRLDQPKSFPYGGGVGDARHNPRRSKFRYETLRPAAWTGDGLPPVGTVCEHGSDANGWSVVRVFTHMDNQGKPLAVSQRGSDGPICLAGPEHYRPIRTPEQIAAEEREKSVVEMLSAFPTLCGSPIAYAQALYDAGYRKQVKP